MYLVTTKIVLNQKTIEEAQKILTSWEKHSEFAVMKNGLVEDGTVLFESEDLDEDGNFVLESLWKNEESFNEFLENELTKEFKEWFDENEIEVLRTLEPV